MANVYVKNPIVLDTFNATADIANLAFGHTKAPVFIQKIVFDNPTAADVFVLKDNGGNVVATLTADDNTTQVAQDFSPALFCHGLQMVTGDQTVTTGTVSIYV